MIFGQEGLDLPALSLTGGYPDLPTSGVQKLYSLVPKVVFYWQKLYSWK